MPVLFIKYLNINPKKMETKKESMKQKQKRLNPNKEPLTAEKLKTFSGFENTPEAEAETIVLHIRSLAGILFQLLSVKTKTDETAIINLHQNQQLCKQAA